MNLLPSRIHAIVTIASAWLDPRSIWMKRAEGEIPRITPYSAAMVRECLKRTFRPYTEEELSKWIKTSYPEHPLPFTTSLLPQSPSILIISPSTVFAAAWQAATAVWLSGGKVILRPSHREPLFGQLLYHSIKSLAAKELPIRILHPNKPISQTLLQSIGVRKVILYGSDETLAKLQTILSPSIKIIGFGTRISFAMIPKKSRYHLKSITQQLAQDALLYDTQGCLSPQGVYVEVGGRVSPLKFAQELSLVMATLHKEWPVHPCASSSIEQESFWQHWKFRCSQKEAQILNPHVIFRKDSTFEPFGQKRCIWIAPVKNLSNLPQFLGSWTSRISTVALPQGDSLHPWRTKWKEGQNIRWCTIGTMHEPEPDWKNSGINLLQTLQEKT